jgi:hypothetical protein
MTQSYVPIVNLPFLYINNLQLSNDATTPNTKLDVAAGQCRDSSNVYDMVLSSAVVINAAVNGINGLDTGTFAASKVYAVYLIADPVSGNATGAMISLDQSSPLMPFGYSAYRKIGYAVTDGSTHFLAGYWSGNNNARQFTYDAPLATSVTAGTSATYAAIDLTAKIPTVDQTPVRFKIDWTANAANDQFNMQGANSTGDAWTVNALVAGATSHTIAFGQVLSQLVSGVPKVNYKVSAVGGVAINIAGYDFYI